MPCVKKHRFLAFFFLVTGSAFIAGTSRAQIDLHAHLHMKPGMNFLLRGDFESSPESDHWSQRSKTRASGTSLAEMDSNSRPKLIVISLYAHPYFGYSFKRDGFHFDRKQNVRKSTEQEYLEFKSWVDAHADRFALVKNPKEARTVIAAGKTAIVLSIEGAWGNFETEDDYRSWIEDRGVAIVTPIHLTPDELGKTGLMTVVISLANSTFDFLESVWSTNGRCLKTFCKSMGGFTQLGEATIERLMKRGVWIDLSHMTESEISTSIQKFKAAGNPPGLVTHTQTRNAYPTERAMGSLESDYIREHDGIVGLMPNHAMLSGVLEQAHQEVLKEHPEEKEAASAAKGLTCISDLDVFKKTIASTIDLLGAPERVAMASDINAPIPGLAPGCGDVNQWLKQTNAVSTDTSSLIDLHRRGYYTYSQWNTLHRYVQPDENWSNRNLEHFLKLWEKIRP